MNPEEILIALKNADAAGDTAAAQKLASLYANALQSSQQPAMDMESGSIADSLGQGVTFGFSDEIAGGLGAGVNSIANLFGAGTGESFGDAYRGIRDAARYNEEAFSARNPKTALGAELVGGLLTGGAGAARVGALKGAQSVGKLAGVGAAQGGLYGAGASEADSVGGLLTDTAKGAAIGGAGGALLPAAGRAVASRFQRAGQAATQAGQPSQRVAGLLDDTVDDVGGIAAQSADDVAAQTATGTQRYLDDVSMLRDKGIALTTGQRTGSDTVKAYETTLRNTTGGGALNQTMTRQREQFQSELLRMAGAPQAVAQAGRITDDAIEATGKALANRYTAALKGKTVTLGDDFIDDLAAVEAKHSRFVTSQQRKEIRTLIDDFLTDATTGGVTGKRYQSLRSLMTKRAQQNQNNNKPLADLFSDLRNALDDAFTASVGTNNKALNTQYAQYKQLETLWRRGGGTKVAQGELPLASMNSLAKKSPGSKEWRRFINAASAVLGDAVPNSGTATRQGLLRQVANVGSGGTLPLAAMAGRYGASQALASGVGSGAPQMVGGLLSAAGRGTQNVANAAGALSGPVGVAAIPGLLSAPPLPPL